MVAAACRIAADAALSCLDGPGAHKAKICDRLKALCVEGTRAQAKHATRALAKLAAAGGAGKDHLRAVFEGVVDAARDDDLLDSNLPAALATMQAVATLAPDLFRERLADVESFVVDDILERPLPRHKSRAPGSVSAVAELRARAMCAPRRRRRPRT